MKQILSLTIYILILSCKNEEILASESMNVSITPRIIGGADADFRYHSYTLSLRLHGTIFCTAFPLSLVDVFATAHCFTLNPDLAEPYLEATVHSGTLSRYELGRIHKIARVTLHPGFTGEARINLFHDIAHILLADETKLGEDQHILQFPRTNIQNGRWGTMTGWGCTSASTLVAADWLQVLQMQIKDFKNCQRDVPDPLYKGQLCGYTSAELMCAQGDSGGPLVIENVVVGIDSWTPNKMYRYERPEIFVNVYQERRFFQSVMQTNIWGGYSCSDDSPMELQSKGKQVQGESSKRKKSKWFRKLLYTAP